MEAAASDHFYKEESQLSVIDGLLIIALIKHHFTSSSLSEEIMKVVLMGWQGFQRHSFCSGGCACFLIIRACALTSPGVNGERFQLRYDALSR
jgi:hypothetical protein